MADRRLSAWRRWQAAAGPWRGWMICPSLTAPPPWAPANSRGVAPLTLAVSTPEGVAPEGMSPEGMAPEGVFPEGVLPEGMSPEGMSPEGTSPEGLSPEGLALEGISPKGLAFEGMSPEGMAPEGVFPEGVFPEGVSPERMTPERVSPERMTPEGVTFTGLTPDGLDPEGVRPEELLAGGATALVVDLEPVLAVRLAAELSARRLADVVLVLPRWPHAEAVLPTEELVAALVDGSRQVRRSEGKRHVVFVLDASRSASIHRKAADSRVDNRYDLAVGDLPNLAQLRAAGIQRVVKLTHARAP